MSVKFVWIEGVAVNPENVCLVRKADPVPNSPFQSELAAQGTVQLFEAQKEEVVRLLEEGSSS